MAATLGKLRTYLGERTLYDAVSQCSRCGYCEQACPTYVATGKEAWSGRGRNQVVRMLLEGRFSDPASAEEALSTCLLCGACTSVCPAHVPTADIVLEGRRMIRKEVPWLARVVPSLLERRPGLFALLLKAAYLLKPLAFLVGFGEAARHVDAPPLEFLRETLEKDEELKDARGAAWLYFAACGTNYLFPRVGLATLRVLKARSGRGARLDNPCCGLLSYNYGDLDGARRLARANIELLERTGAPAPVVADCSSCAAHLKAYPQLFMDDAEWKTRAEAFSARVRDVVELLPQVRTRPRAGEATYHDACRARNGQGIVEQPRAVMRAVCGGAYRELPHADACCGGAGAFAFVHPELSEDLLKRKIGAIAETQARVVATSSTSCLLQLARGLKKYYPECRVVHLSELVAEEPHG